MLSGGLFDMLDDIAQEVSFVTINYSTKFFFCYIIFLILFVNYYYY